MAGTVSFKVYLSSENEPSKNEVRRFGVEADVVTNFVYLREKIQTIFPSLRGKHFTVSWKDSDGDDVTISSDEELQIALDETALSDIRKLHVILHSEYSTPRNSTESQSNDAGPIHFGVSCDGCDKQVQGFRYKCIQCADYDLCVDCESRGMHPEHCMIRLSIPLQWKPHYGRRLATQVNRFVRKAQSNTCKEEEPKQHCPYKSGKHHGKSRHGADPQSWIDTFATYLDEWANLPGECPMKEAAKEAKEQAAPPPSSEPKNAGRDNEKSPSEQIRLLTNVGLAVGENFLSQFFDPLVNIQAKTDKPTSSASAASSASSASASASASGSASPPADKVKENASQVPEETVPVAKFPGEGKKLCETGNGEAAASSQSPSGEKSTPEKVFVENEGWTLLNKSDSPISSLSSAASGSTGAVPKQVQPSAPVDTASKPIYPKLVMEEKPMEAKPVYHPNPTIQKSVESMIQMGFSNEGGWLTNLLISKGGDIAAALDALSPVKR